MSTLLKIKDKIISFVKKEVVLSIAFVAMIVTCFFIPPDKSYLGYFEYKTLAGNNIFDFAKSQMKGEISFLEAIEKAHLLQNENLHKYTVNLLFVIECMPFLLEKYREKTGGYGFSNQQKRI